MSNDEILTVKETAALLKTTRQQVRKMIRKRRTPGLLVRRLSHAQIGVISAPICAFYHRSLGGFSIVSVQPCPLFSDSGSKVGQRGFYNYEPQVVGYNILSTYLSLLIKQNVFDKQ